MIQVLTPEQCIERLMKRVRDRVVALEGVNLTEYRVAIAELKNVLDSMTRARDYIRTVSALDREPFLM